MYWLKLKVREQVVRKDNDFLVKVPIMPNRYLFETRDYTLAAYKSEADENTYYLQTDNENFYSTYKKYYEERFDTEEMESDFQIPQGFTAYIGSANNEGIRNEGIDADNEAPTEEEEYDTEEEEAVSEKNK